MSDEAASAGKIKLHCHACGAKYLVRANKVQGRRFRAKCKRCGGIIVARHDGDAAFTVLPEMGTGRGHRSEAHVRLDSNDLDHHHQDLHGHDPYGASGYVQEDEQGGEWYVVVGGLPQGPFGADAVRDGLSDGRFTPRNYVWRPGQTDWQRLRDHPLFASPAGIPPEGTAETNAAGPRGVRRDDPYYAGPSDETRESSINDVDEGLGEMESEATRLHPARWDDLPPADAPPQLDPRGGPGGAWGRADEGPAFGRRAPGKLEPAVDIFDERNWAKGEGPDAGFYAQGAATPEPWNVGEDHIGGWQSAPRRRAILPSPSRSMRPSAAGGPQDFGDAPVEFGAPQAVGPAHGGHDNYTRPLDEHERAAAVAQPQLSGRLSRRSPMPLPKPPPPPRKTHDSLSWIPDPVPLGPSATVGGVAQALPFLQPKPEPFWTAGKIVAVAAIGGGLAVAATVTLIIVLTRDKTAPLPPRATIAVRQPATPGIGQTVRHAAKPQLPITVNTQPPTKKAEPKAAAVAKKVESPAAAKGSGASPNKGDSPPPVKVVAAAGSAGSAKGKGSGDKASRAPPKSARRKSARRKSEPPRRRVVVRTTPVRKRGRRARSRRRGSKKSDIDSLIDGALSSKKKTRKRASSGAVDPDALLAAGAGTRKKKKKKSAAVDPDALLAAASSPRKKRAGLSRGQVSRGMRRLRGRVRNCFDKYKVPGLLKVYVTVQPSGRASAFAVGVFKSTPTGRCVSSGVARIVKFPSFSGPAFSFTYPFQLR